LKPEKNKQVWNAGWTSRIGLVFTFLVTLFWPIQYAVLIGVLLSFTLYFFTSSRLVKLHRLQLLSDGWFKEMAVPRELESEAVHVFAVDGGLHFAGARMLERQWPKLGPHTRRPVIILELRGRNNIGATLTEVLLNYFDKIEKAEGRFYITELGERSYAMFKTQAASQLSEGMQIRKNESIVGKSTQRAVLEAQAWLNKFAPEK
jgi:SulP family sulfate permease